VQIEVDREPDRATLEARGVFDWPIWTKEVSRFPYQYDEEEQCLFLEGEVVVTPDGGTPMTIRAGDFVVFPAGMSCTWDIRSRVRKHYHFG
jgi:uncharacterized protein